MKISFFASFFLLSTIISLFKPKPLQGQEENQDIEQTKYKRDVRMKLVYKVNVSQHIDNLRLLLTVPGDVPLRQSVQNRNFSVEPDSLYFQNSNVYALFKFTDVDKDFKITLTSDLSIYRFIPKTREKPDTGFASYTAAEKYIESESPGIIAIASGLKKKTDIETVIETYNYVKEKIHYVVKPEEGAEQVLQSGEGKCMDFSDLFVALLRANKIPAKSMYGITVDYHSTPFHAWPEAYLQKQGWVLFDPTTGQSSITADGNNYKMHIKNKYIILLEGRNDPVMNGPSLFHYSWHTYSTKAASVKIKVAFDFVSI